MILLLWIAGLLSAAPKMQRFEMVEPHMGTTVTIRLYAPTESAAKIASTQAFARIHQLDEIFSDYNPKSEVSRLTTGKPQRVSEDLFTVLEAAQALAVETDGAFDVTIGALTSRWRQAIKEKRLLTAAERDAALQSSGFRYLNLDKKKRTVELTRPGMRLDLGGIVKGYAAREAVRVLRKKGCPSALVSVSGDIAIGDPPPGLPAWLVQVEPAPGISKVLQLHSSGVSTSGDREQFLELDGKRYSHIIDPRTGEPLTNGLGVSVVTADPMMADALATAICVLGKQHAQQLSQAHTAPICTSP